MNELTTFWPPAAVTGVRIVERLGLDVDEHGASALRLRSSAHHVNVDHSRPLLLGREGVVGDDERDLRLRVEVVQVLGRGVGPWAIRCDVVCVVLMLSITACHRGQ